MSSPLSSDLRERVVHPVEEGASRCCAARRVEVGPSGAIRWQESFAQEGRVAAKPQDGDRRSQYVEAQADLILSFHEVQSTISLSELRGLLAERGMVTSESGLSQFFKRHGITRKQTRRTRQSRFGPM